jgi:hypothetical protein
LADLRPVQASPEAGLFLTECDPSAGIGQVLRKTIGKGASCLGAQMLDHLDLLPKDLVEAQCRQSWQLQVLAAEEQSRADQVANGPLNGVPLAEVVGVVGQLTDDFRKSDVGWVDRQDLDQSGALVVEVLRIGRVGAAGFPATRNRLVVHGS